VTDLIEWTLYGDNEGMQGADYGDLLLLIKYLEESDQWVYIVGDKVDVKRTGFTGSESDAKACAIRYCWAVNNMTPERAEALFN
jgi:hypothetical protein